MILGKIWDECLKLALEGMAAGSLGISAVIAAPSGEIVSRGRNQLFDKDESCNIVRNCDLAHAELNAIATIPQEYRGTRDLTLYATVEPCPLCMGAVVMSKVRTLHIACRDPWAGSVRILDKDWYLEKKKIDVSYESGIIEKTFFFLHLLSIRRRLEKHKWNSNPFMAAIEAQYPEYFSHLAALEGDTAFFEDLLAGRGERIVARIGELQE